jgi:hypothetical protein
MVTSGDADLEGGARIVRVHDRRSSRGENGERVQRALASVQEPVPDAWREYDRVACFELFLLPVDLEQRDSSEDKYQLLVLGMQVPRSAGPWLRPLLEHTELLCPQGGGRPQPGANARAPLLNRLLLPQHAHRTRAYRSRARLRRAATPASNSASTSSRRRHDRTSCGAIQADEPVGLGTASSRLPDVSPGSLRGCSRPRGTTATADRRRANDSQSALARSRGLPAQPHGGELRLDRQSPRPRSPSSR